MDLDSSWASYELLRVQIRRRIHFSAYLEFFFCGQIVEGRGAGHVRWNPRPLSLDYREGLEGDLIIHTKEIGSVAIPDHHRRCVWYVWRVSTGVHWLPVLLFFMNM